MKRFMSETSQAEFGGILNVASKRQLASFELPLHHGTEGQRFTRINKMREFLYKFSKGIEDGRELARKYGRE